LPIQHKSRFQSNVTWKPFGLSLKLNVTHHAGNTVRLDIESEVSHLDAKIGSDQIPGLQTNRIKTQVDVRFGIPLLLCGLLKDTVRKQARGLPFLKDIPILGSLFGSDDYLNEHSELIAILIANSAPPMRPMKKMGLSHPEGPVPAPRDWISPMEQRRLEADPNYPWNALEEETEGDE